MSEQRNCRTFPDVPASTLAGETHFTVIEIANLWKVSPQTVRRMFSNEDGVLKFGSAETRFKRKRETLRIPESVAARVHTRLHKRA